MAEIHNALRLSGVRETIREPLTLLAQHLGSGLGDNLKGITVVGSSLTEDFQPATSDVNTVVLLNEHSIAALNVVASNARTMRKSRLAPPLLMTRPYIERSRDVFGIEFLDFQLVHQTVLGEDPFASLRIEKQDVRLQCERELKAMLVRLRQGYIDAARDHGLIHDMLVATAKGLAPLTRAMLWLRDIERPRAMEPALRRAAAEFNVRLDDVVAAEQWRYQKARPTNQQVENTFAAILAAVDQLTTTVDELTL